MARKALFWCFVAAIVTFWSIPLTIAGFPLLLAFVFPGLAAWLLAYIPIAMLLGWYWRSDPLLKKR